MDLGVQRGLVVFGEDKLDEISLSAPTKVCEFQNAWIKSYTITPEDFGLTRCSKADLVGGDPAQNAEILRAIIAGATGPKTDAALLNAGALLMIGGLADTLAEGITLARETIASGRVVKTLDALVELSQRKDEESAL